MRLFTPRAKAALICELHDELAKHDSNLQRALDGKAAAYVPNSTQRNQLEDEQVRVDAILQGLTLLSVQWHVTKTDLPPLRNTQKRDDLLAQALADTAVAIIRSGQDYAPQYRYTIEDLQALNALFRYLNSKIYHLAKLPAEISDTDVYTTLHSAIGYKEVH